MITSAELACNQCWKQPESCRELLCRDAGKLTLSGPLLEQLPAAPGLNHWL